MIPTTTDQNRRDIQQMNIEYFTLTLNPRAGDGYDMFARASQDAIIAYSKRIRTSYPLFADQLLAWAEKEKDRQDEMLK
jgi:hypothetical protein